MTGAVPKVRLETVERFERDVRLRLPFRFGVITVTEATQAVIRVAVALEDGRRAVGVAAETLAAKWFDKNLALSDEQNLDQLRQALEIAVRLYTARGWSTAFGLYADSYLDQLARGAALGLDPLVASYGQALLVYLRHVPKRAARVRVPDPADTSHELDIALDPHLNAQQNAARYFKRAAKAPPATQPGWRR